MRKQWYFAVVAPFLYPGLFVPLALAQSLDTIQLSSNYYSVPENSGSITIQLQRAGPMTDYASLQVSAVPGTADTNDFEAFSRTVTFAPGESNLAVSIAIFNDALAETAPSPFPPFPPDPQGEVHELFEIVLSDPDPFCCQLGQLTRATVQIQDDDPGVHFGAFFYGFYENDGDVQIDVLRLGDMTNAAGSIRFEIEERTARRDVDFTIATNRLSFSAGQTNATIAISILNNAVAESAKNFILRFEQSPDLSCCSVGYLRTADVWIYDNDVGVEFSDWTEVREDAGEVQFTLQRRGDLIAQEGYVILQIFTNSWWGAEGTAIPDVDFSAPTDAFAVDFSAGESNVTLSIEIFNDSIVENREQFGVVLLNELSSLPLGTQTNAYISIIDNDLGVEFGPFLYQLAEPGGASSVLVHRIGDATNAFSVDIESRGSATVGQDFMLATNRLFFPSGQSNVVMLLISVLDDPLVEGSEDIRLELVNATGGVPLGARRAQSIPLHDNEYWSAVTGFWFPSNQLFAVESQTNAFITVVRGGNSSSTLSVDFVTLGEAAAGLDFSPASGTVVFQPLETVKNIALHLINDCRVETNEIAEIMLTNPSPPASVLDPSRASLRIADADAPGSLDSFNPTLDWLSFPNTNDAPTTAIALQPDGKILIGRNGVMARLNNDGSQDPSFAHGATICGFFGGRGGIGIPTTLCRVNTIVLEPNGGILAGGLGSAIRLNRAGVLDSNSVVTAVSYGFHGAILPGSINQLLGQADGKIIVFGTFDTINGEGEWCGWSWCDVSPSRLNADSSIDRTFARDPQLAQAARGALLPDGKILAVTWGSLLRLHPDGSRDDAFPLVSTDGQINAIAVRPDQRVLIGGQFSRVTNDYRRALAGLNANGSLDTNFNPAIALDDAGEIIAIHTLTLREDGSIFLAGSFSDGSTRVLKLDSDGRLSPEFNSGLRFNSRGFSATINSIIEEPNGELLVAGDFDNVNGVPRPGIARLKNARSHIQLSPPQLRPDGSLRIVTGSHVGNTYVLQRSSDLTAWTDISTNVATGCTLDLQDPNPASTRFYRVVELNR
jgi:uncharacterized delta-60 repeat protein